MEAANPQTLSPRSSAGSRGDDACFLLLVTEGGLPDKPVVYRGQEAAASAFEAVMRALGAKAWELPFDEDSPRHGEFGYAATEGRRHEIRLWRLWPPAGNALRGKAWVVLENVDRAYACPVAFDSQAEGTAAFRSARSRAAGITSAVGFVPGGFGYVGDAIQANEVWLWELEPMAGLQAT